MVIGTSAIVDTELDGAVGMNSGIFNNPFLIWGRYRRGLSRTTLPLSFQFHHTQMDGAHAGRFLQRLQEGILALENRQPERGQEGPDDQKEVLTWKIYLKRMRSASVIEILQRAGHHRAHLQPHPRRAFPPRHALRLHRRGRMVKEMSAGELEARCRKCMRLDVSDTRALARVLDRQKAGYRIVDDTHADLYTELPVTELVLALDKERCAVRSIKERDESLENFYMHLIGGVRHA